MIPHDNTEFSLFSSKLHCVLQIKNIFDCSENKLHQLLLVEHGRLSKLTE